MKLLELLLFNRFVKGHFNSDSWFMKINNRLKCLMLEFQYCLSVNMPFMILLILIAGVFGGWPDNKFSWPELLLLAGFNLIQFTILNKDFFGAQSPVHRKLGYQVVDSQTGQPATPLRCMLRNITAPLWIIEGIFVLVHPKRRLGDFFAGTMLIEVGATDPELILDEIRKARFDRETKVVMLFSLAWVLIMVLLFDYRVRSIAIQFIRDVTQ